MTPAEYTAALSTLGLDTDQAAAWLGVSKRTAYQYAKTGPKGPAARAVRLALAVISKRDYYAKKKGEADPTGYGSSNLWCERAHTVEAMNVLVDELGLALDWRE